jgi:hypothetical protein
MLTASVATAMYKYNDSLALELPVLVGTQGAASTLERLVQPLRSKRMARTSAIA